MANSYSGADIVAAWQFEDPSPGFLKDTKAIQPDLSNTGPVTQDTTNYMEGARCASFAAGQYLTLTDANLAAGFPFKSGDTLKVMTLNFRVRPTTVDTNKRVIASKWNTTGNQRGWSISQNSTAIYLDYSNNGTTVQTAINFGNPMTANQKYFISLSVDAVNLFYWFRIYSYTAGTWASKAGVLVTTIFASTADFRLGADCQVAANTTFIGQMDEVTVSTNRFHNSEALAMYGGTFPVAAGVGIYDWLYDPAMAADTYDGFSATTAAYKTLKHSFGPADIIYGIKAVETVKQTGNATATNGSLSVSGITGWTPAQYDVIRFDSETTLYTVASYAGGVAVLGRTYEGTTGATKTISLLTRVTLASLDWDFPYFSGTLALPIIFKGGVNFTNFAQDGFSCWNGGSYWTNGKTIAYCNYSRILCYGGTMGLYYNCSVTGCNYTSFFLVNTALVGANYGCTYGSASDATVGIVFEQYTGGGNPGATQFNCIYYNPKFGVSAYLYMTYALDVIMYNPSFDGCTGSNVIQFAGHTWGVKLINPILDRQNKGGTSGISFYNNAANPMCEDVEFINPTLGNGFRYLPVNAFGASYCASGEINLVNVNGDPTDNRAYYASGYSSAVIGVLSDNTYFKTAAPSARVVLPGVATTLPFFVRHYLPCAAGVPRTISAWLRKNSAPITTVTIANGGSGYAVGDYFSVTQANGDLSIFRVLSLSVTAVLSVSIIQGGFGYSVANGLATSTLSGGGSGCTINITAVGTGYGSNVAGSVALPFMRVRWFTGTAPNLVHNSADYPMADVNDAFQRVQSAQITPSVKGTIIVEFYFQSSNPGALAWYDDISG